MDARSEAVDPRSEAAAVRARIVHELRTPLTVIAGRAQLLRRRSAADGADAAPTSAELDAIEDAIDRLTAAVDEVDRILGRDDPGADESGSLALPPDAGRRARRGGGADPHQLLLYPGDDGGESLAVPRVGEGRRAVAPLQPGVPRHDREGGADEGARSVLLITRMPERAAPGPPGGEGTAGPTGMDGMAGHEMGTRPP